LNNWQRIGLAGNWTYCQFFETFQEPRTGGYFILNFKKRFRTRVSFLQFSDLKKNPRTGGYNKIKEPPNISKNPPLL